MPKPDVQYTPYNQTGSAVPDVAQPDNDYFSVHADASDFGGQIGQAEEGLGKVGQQISTEAMDFYKMSSEAKAQDDFANKFSPAAANLRQKFDMLDGQDKIQGAEDYKNGLQTMYQQFAGDDADGGMYYKQVMGQLIGRHVFAETTGVNREIVDSQKKFATSSADDLMAANNGYASSNYNNPEVFNQMADSNHALVVKQFIDGGHDPNDPDSQQLIKDKQDAVTGDMAVGMIKRAVASNDTPAANEIRQQNSPFIPGYQQLALDNFLHSANMQQNVSNAGDALFHGQPLPQMVGAPHSSVQSVVANTAYANGIDPNEALTVARIESSYGENVGSRGTIGQDKGSAGKSLDDQAQALCDNWAAAKTPAQNALGRPPEGWEQYTVYQQGAGGGPALLKADPNARAVDVLKPLYKNPQDAVDAIVKNGGNASMSVGDFLAQEKQRYGDNNMRAKCDFTSGGATPGEQIEAPHQTQGNAVQPGANPMQDLRNWNRANEATLTQIQAIPNVETRQRLLEDNKQKTAVFQTKAESYKNDLVNQAGQLAANPQFTDMNQVPPDMHSALLEANPATLSYMESRAEYNLNHASGSVTKDQQTYGKGVNAVLSKVWSGDITTPAQLHDYVKSGDLNIAGFDRLKQEMLSPKEDPSTKASELKMQQAAFNSIELQVTKGMKDSPAGAAAWAATLPALYKAIDERKSRTIPIPAGQYYDSSNKEYIGNSVAALTLPKSTAVASQINANKAAVKDRTLGDIIADSRATKDPAVQKQLMQEAMDKGYFKPNEPQVPLAGGQ